MKTTPQASAGCAQTAWVAYGMSRRGALTIGRNDRADAGRTTRVESTRSTRRRRIPRYACLVRRTGRIAGWREWRQNSAQTNRYSQEVKSHEPPLTVRRVLCDVQRYLVFFGPAPHTRQPRLPFARQPDRPVVVLKLCEPRI